MSSLGAAMKYLQGVKIIYSHPAVPSSNINIGWTYTIGYDKRGLYIDDGNLEQVIDLESLQCLFTPIDVSWQELMMKGTKIKDINDKPVDKILIK